jgi:hypothetical protein
MNAAAQAKASCGSCQTPSGVKVVGRFERRLPTQRSDNRIACPEQPDQTHRSGRRVVWPEPPRSTSWSFQTVGARSGGGREPSQRPVSSMSQIREMCDGRPDFRAGPVSPMSQTPESCDGVPGFRDGSGKAAAFSFSTADAVAVRRFGASTTPEVRRRTSCSCARMRLVARA